MDFLGIFEARIAGDKNAPVAVDIPRVHAMCGLVGAGKTTVARQLSKELPALRLTRDEWMLQLYGPLRHDDPEYVEAIPRCTDRMWDVATQALSLGVGVILDWNHWDEARRGESRGRAAAAGTQLVVHFVDVSLEVAVAQASARLSLDEAGSHRIEEHEVRHFATIFEPPDRHEGFEVVHHRR